MIEYDVSENCTGNVNDASTSLYDDTEPSKCAHCACAIRIIQSIIQVHIIPLDKPK